MRRLFCSIQHKCKTEKVKGTSDVVPSCLLDTSDFIKVLGCMCPRPQTVARLV